MRKGVCRGFTLVEVLIALTIGSIIVLVTHLLFSHAVEASRRITDAGSRFDREQLAGRWLRSAFLSLDVNEGAGPFEGASDHLSFTSWLVVSGGWTERTPVRLGLTDSTLEARNSRNAFLLQRDVRHVEFDYLLVPGANSRWVSVWVSPVSAPVAVRIRLYRTARIDTLLFAVGERG